MIFGMAGSIRAAQLIHYKLSLAPRAENIADMEYLVESFAEDVRACLKAGGVAHVENNVEEGNGFLLGYNGVLYFVDDDYQITSFGDNMQAIGAGRQYALGAMVGYANLSPRERIIASLEASARFCAAVCPPWTVEVLGNGKEE
jgi:ATP-dependent protease HslVU (ClpYQ) peptidase subunit